MSGQQQQTIQPQQVYTTVSQQQQQPTQKSVALTQQPTLVQQQQQQQNTVVQQQQQNVVQTQQNAVQVQQPQQVMIQQQQGGFAVQQIPQTFTLQQPGGGQQTLMVQPAQTIQAGSVNNIAIQQQQANTATVQTLQQGQTAIIQGSPYIIRSAGPGLPMQAVQVQGATQPQQIIAAAASASSITGAVPNVTAGGSNQPVNAIAIAPAPGKIGPYQKLDAHPLKEDMGITNILPTFFIGNIQINKHILGRKGKEDMEIPKIFDHFWYKVQEMEIPNFFTILDIKKIWKFPFFFSRIPVFLRSKFEPWNSQILNFKYACLLWRCL